MSTCYFGLSLIKKTEKYLDVINVLIDEKLTITYWVCCSLQVDRGHFLSRVKAFDFSLISCTKPMVCCKYIKSLLTLPSVIYVFHLPL